MLTRDKIGVGGAAVKGARCGAGWPPGGTGAPGVKTPAGKGMTRRPVVFPGREFHVAELSWTFDDAADPSGPLSAPAVPWHPTNAYGLVPGLLLMLFEAEVEVAGSHGGVEVVQDPDDEDEVARC